LQKITIVSAIKHHAKPCLRGPFFFSDADEKHKEIISDDKEQTNNSNESKRIV